MVLWPRDPNFHFVFDNQLPLITFFLFKYTLLPFVKDNLRVAFLFPSFSCGDTGQLLSS